MEGRLTTSDNIRISRENNSLYSRSDIDITSFINKLADAIAWKMLLGDPLESEEPIEASINEEEDFIPLSMKLSELI